MSGPSPDFQSVQRLAHPKEDGGRPRPFRDVWQWLGISGDASGTNGTLRRTFLYTFAAAAVMVAIVNTLNVITATRDLPGAGLTGVIVWEGSSWVSLMAVFWIPWLGYRMAPPFARPRIRLLVHLPCAFLFSLAHVWGFILLRDVIYWLAGDRYDFGPFWPNFSYELRKDALGYVLFIAGFALMEHLLRQQQRTDATNQAPTFDIRDGARLTRVPVTQILAVNSAGNYVEFVLGDGRRLLMRSPLSAIEAQLSGCGFLRTHRSWLVNTHCVTGLMPQGSGDYTVELGDLLVPLSRRFPETLIALRSVGTGP